jgi:hypothetical protein
VEEERLITTTEEVSPARPRRGGGCGLAVGLLLGALGGAILVVAALFFLGQGLLGNLLPRAVGLPGLPTLPTLPTPAPTPTPTIITGAAVVQRIQGLSRLETVTYSIQTVVTVERPGSFLGIGSQRLLVIVHGNVVAGVDLGKLRPQDVTVLDNGRRVVVRLPEAEIFSAQVDGGRTEVYDHQTGLFTQPDTNLVVEAQKAAGEKVLQAACADGVMQQATEQAEQALRQIIGLMEIERIDFETGPTPPCAGPTPVVTTRTPGTPAPAAATPTPRR